MSENNQNPASGHAAGVIGTPVMFLQLVDTAFTKSWTLWTAALVAIAMVVSGMYGLYPPTQVSLGIAGSDVLLQHFIMRWNTLQCPYWVSGVVVGCGTMVVYMPQGALERSKDLDVDFKAGVLFGFVLGFVLGPVCGPAFGLAFGPAFGLASVFAFGLAFGLASGLISGLPILDILQFEVVWISLLVLLFGGIFILIGVYRRLFRRQHVK